MVFQIYNVVFCVSFFFKILIIFSKVLKKVELGKYKFSCQITGSSSGEACFLSLPSTVIYRSPFL